jgi:hypothetical protein
MIISPGLADELFKRRVTSQTQLGTVVFADKPNDPLQARVDEMIEQLNNSLYGPSDRTKWERIGQPLVESIVDWGIIIWPTTPTKLRQKAIQRQIERFVELS